MGDEGYSGCMYVYMFVRECICTYVYGIAIPAPKINLLLTFEIFGRARNHGKKFPKYS